MSGADASLRVGIDIGGTFTDFVLGRPDGSMVSHKQLTTPQDPVEGFVLGLFELLRKANVAPADVGEIFHATTLGSNVVIERRGAPVAFVTTRGFRDVLEIQRALRYSIYDTQMQKPQPLVPRSRIWEAGGRMGFEGNEIEPLAVADVRKAAREMAAKGVVSVGVGFLHAYANPAHEQMARDILREEAPEIHVTISSDISRLAREYTRFNTTAVNAYLAPVFGDYLARLETALAGRKVTAPIWIMQSSGGLTTRERAAEIPVRSIESGPAAGVIMAAHHSRLAGAANVISFDMGGTTAKASIVTNNKPSISRSFELDRLEMRNGSGLPIDTLAIDLIEIGTGGGSIAHCKAGALQVGPRSASSEPGPVCYGRGGTEPTVTDAALVLGYLDADAFAGGSIKLDVAASQAAIGGLGRELGLDMVRTAWGIHQLVVLSMERATRLISIDKGLDPRDYAMICFGGAGPLHGARLARALGIRRVIVPGNGGVGSAVGLLEAQEAVELAQTKIVKLRAGDFAVQAETVFADLTAQAHALVGGNWDGGALNIRRTVGLRYAGQGHELELELDGREDFSDPAALRRAFDERYALIYGYPESLDVEIAMWRVAVARMKRRPAAALPPVRETSSVKQRQAYFGETGLVACRVYRRLALSPSDRVKGPCMIEENDTTTVLLPGDTGFVDAHGALIVDIGETA